MQDITLFQFCQKIVVLNEDFDMVLLVKRKGEADFDGTFSFIGGKMETTDGGIINGLRREKTEEIGVEANLSVYPLVSYNEYYVKKNGSAMVLPHYFAVYHGGEIIINEEYSEYQWIKLSELSDFQPKIDTIEPAVRQILRIKNLAEQKDMVNI